MRYAFILNSAATLGIALSFFASCESSKTVNYVAANAAHDQEVHVEIPQDSWEPIFFREIDRRTTLAKLLRLRSMVLANGDLEARFWVDASYFGMDGIIVRRSSGIWSGTYIHGFSRKPDFKQYDDQLQQPRSGWDKAWQRLTEAGLLTLPDASKVGCKVGGKDGIVFVFETNVNRTYRTYMYNDPAYAQCNEAKQMLNIISIINQEFGLQWPTTK
jgi:hypothetical protein